MRTILLKLVISIALATTASEQSFSKIPDLLSVDCLTTDERMPSNEVRKVYKDRIGYMWFLTDRGIAKYNAHDFLYYKQQMRNPNSLSSEETTDILEGDDRIFWIATKTGINRFDSITGEFKHYIHNDDDPTTLSDDYVTSMLVDRNGRFWIATYLGGLNSFDPQTGKFQSFRHDPNDPHSIASDHVNKLALDSSGKIWVGMLDSTSIDRFDPEANTFEHHGIVKPDEGHPDITCVYVDSTGRVWYGSWGLGLYCYNPSDGSYRNYRNDPTVPYSICGDIVQCITEDEKGWFWIGTRNTGICIFDPKTERFHPVKLVRRTDPNATIDTILNIYWDEQGILWLGTLGDGVCYFDSNRETIQYLKNNPKDPNTLAENAVFALSADPDGSIWIGTDGGGLDRYDPNTGDITHYFGETGDPSRLDSKTVVSLLHDRKGNLWVGSWENDNAPLSRFDREKNEFRCYPKGFDDPKKYICSVVRTMCEDYTGILWLGAERAGLVAFDPITEIFQYYEKGKKGLFDTTYRKIYEDRSLRLWIATEEGLQYYDRTNDRFENFQLDSRNPVQLPIGLYLTIFEDSRSNLWVGTDKGLVKLDPNRESAEILTTEDGLADNVVKAILEDNSGYLWFSLDNGKLSRYDPETKRVLNFDKSDGIQNRPFTSNCHAMGQNGELYFGGLNGLNCIWPNQIVPNEYVPPVVITSFEVMGASYPFEKSLVENHKIVLDYFQNFISFEFAALNFTRSHKNQYKYRLQPLEKEWNLSGARRYARYTLLQPGDYTLQVIGSNNDSLWNEEGISIPIRIQPPFWKTWWFQLGIAGSILLLIYSRYRDLQNQKMRLEAEVKRQTKELSEANIHLERLSLQDGLTQLSNRRCFDAHIRSEWQRGLRSKTHLSLLFFDVDHFKKYNDSYGHIAGDECLKQVAKVLRNNVKRPGDLAARYGGEEFVIVLTDANPENTVTFAERLLREVEALNIPHETSPISNVVTVSIGVSSYIPTLNGSINDLIKAADEGVYQAKNAGRNRTAFVEPAVSNG